MQAAIDQRLQLQERSAPGGYWRDQLFEIFQPQLALATRLYYRCGGVALGCAVR
jgi:hypothetical protein